MSDYKRNINSLKFNGVQYRTFINDDAEMVIRYNEHNGNYTDEVYDPAGNLVRIDEYTHTQIGGIK